MDKYIIIGQTPDGVEHFINVSHDGDGYFRMLIRTLRYRYNSKLRYRYSKIYLKKMSDDFVDYQMWKYTDNYRKGLV